MAFFGKGAPQALRTVSDGEGPWTPLDDEQDEGGNEEEGRGQNWLKASWAQEGIGRLRVGQPLYPS